MRLGYLVACMLIAAALLVSPEPGLGRGGGGHGFGGGFHGGFAGHGFSGARGFRGRGFSGWGEHGRFADRVRGGALPGLSCQT